MNALKEIPGRRDQGIGTLSKDPTSALDFKDLGLTGLLNRIREPGLIFIVIRIMANIVEMNFYYN